jgi:hypothetical protein
MIKTRMRDEYWFRVSTGISAAGAKACCRTEMDVAPECGCGVFVEAGSATGNEDASRKCRTPTAVLWGLDFSSS